jgi:hypothetical protein
MNNCIDSKKDFRNVDTPPVIGDVILYSTYFKHIPLIIVSSDYYYDEDGSYGVIPLTLLDCNYTVDDNDDCLNGGYTTKYYDRRHYLSDMSAIVYIKKNNMHRILDPKINKFCRKYRGVYDEETIDVFLND